MTAVFFSQADRMLRIGRQVRRFRRGALFPLLVILWACGENEQSELPGNSQEQGKMVKSPPLPERFGLGREPSPAQITSLDIDVNPAGTGLPAGEGTYGQGATLYAQKCAVCHGARGEGVSTFPRLIGVEHQRDFSFGDDPKYVKTIGNYWPYATTLYDYIHRTMPYSAPGSLQPAEVYSLVAFLLSENAIIPKTSAMNRETLPRVVMPARDRFRLDDRKGGPSFR